MLGRRKPIVSDPYNTKRCCAYALRTAAGRVGQVMRFDQSHAQPSEQPQRLIACDCAGHGPIAIVLASDPQPAQADRDGFAVDPPLVLRPACARHFCPLSIHSIGCAAALWTLTIACLWDSRQQAD